MENKFFDKLFDQLIEDSMPEYLKIEKKNTNDEELENVQVPNGIENDMENIFASMRRKEKYAKMVNVSKKVAVVIAALLIVSCGLITTVEAWRKEVVKFIMKNNDDNYMSINFEDGSEENSIEENSGDEAEEEAYTTYEFDDVKFMYVPEGMEITDINRSETTKIFNFNSINGEYIIFKIFRNIGLDDKEFDIETTKNEKYSFGDKEVYKVIKNDDRINYVWCDDGNIYTIFSNIDENNILKFIENIKILKNI